MRRKPVFLCLSLVVLVCAIGRGESPTAAGSAPLRYNRDIRPILAENCFACHGPDSASRKADLRLDRREDAIAAEAFMPRDAANSELVRRIHATDEDDRMPPPEAHKVLTPAQKQMLKRWIDEGAEYEPHWSLITPAKPELPAVKNTGWARNPIDRFVLAQLEAAGLSPAPEADRHTLARRLALDLTGLPPAPDELQAFVNDTSPDYYERYVSMLMAKPAWGEHRGRYWLDAARYADTHGLHFDNFREMWTYRDWVIDAFNRNMPFDQFTIEQLAGDLLPDRTLDQQVATGFNRCLLTTNEGGTIPEENLVLYMKDRVETTALVFLGLTANCAACHDHKFDPLTQREFYELAAFFNNTTQGALDGNIKDTPPILLIPTDADKGKWDEVAGQVESVKASIAEHAPVARKAFDEWLTTAEPQVVADNLPRQGLIVEAPLNEGEGQSVAVKLRDMSREVVVDKLLEWTKGHLHPQAYRTQPDLVLDLGDAGNLEADRGFSYGAWVNLDDVSVTGALLARMDEKDNYHGWDLWLEDGKVGTHIIHQWPTDAVKVVSRGKIKAKQWNHVLITYDGSRKATGVKIYLNGKVQVNQVANDNLKGSIRTPTTLKVGQRSEGARLNGLAIQDVRIYERTLSAEEADALASAPRVRNLLAKKEREEKEVGETFAWYQAALDEKSQQLTAELTELESRQSRIKARGKIAYVMQEKPEPAMAYVLFRGEYDKRRDEVTPGTPAMLPPMPAGLPHNRLGFAQWLLLPEHPLTARVAVNRFWQEVFGAGLVRTAGDFGVTGDLPSHPQLLDYLAVDFRESGWDVQRLLRLIVTSATYRQSAATTPEKLRKDPTNRLLSRGPRFRMDAEMIRDYALQTSGLLSAQIGGPSVRPYQPEGVWEAVAMIGSNTREYRPDADDALYRRSMYTFWKRAAPPASMEIFNAPSRETCTVRRERSNTPLQALVTLNDPQFVEAARHLAQLTLHHSGDEAQRLAWMAQHVLLRPLRDAELTVLAGALQDLLAYYRSNTADAAALIAVGQMKPDPAIDPAVLAAWTMTANQLLNLDEVLTK